MGSGRLLLVDDEDNFRSMLTAALGHLGFEVTAVATGREAIETAGTLRPDLVVLDVMLEDLDGFEVCRRLRAAGDATPVLFLTAKRGGTARARCPCIPCALTWTTVSWKPARPTVCWA
jgi:two-component system OmpR family response regulator